MGGPPPPRVLWASAICACLLLLAGCGAEAEGEPELAIYLSAPLSGPSAGDGRDIADGAELALADADGEAAGTAVRLEVLDGATDDGWDPVAAAANARAAAQDSAAIAYLGELESGATRTSLPITNEAGLLHVSAGSAAADLVAEAIGSERIPELTQPSGARTFGRVIPSDVRQGEAAGVWMEELGVESVQVIGGEDPFGQALLSGLDSSGAPLQVEGEGPLDAGYLAVESTFRALPRLADVRGETSVLPSPELSLFGSDALLDPEDLTSFRIATEACRTRTDCPGGPREIRLTSAALDPTQLPPAAADFLAAFEDVYGREPGRYAAYGYEAMGVILDSIERAEDPLDRGAVVDAFFATTERDSILGSYSIDDVGETTLAGLGAYRIVGGRPRPEPEPITLP